MIIPWQKDDEFLADVNEARSKSGVHIWWLGQSGFLVAWQGEFLLLDPYLSDSLTRKYSTTDKPHVRMTQRVVDPARLDFINVVTSSHNHTDHLDAETLCPLLQANSQLSVVVPAANIQCAADRLDIRSERLTPIQVGQPETIGSYCLHAVPAAHEQLQQDRDGRHHCLGYVVTFGDWAIYHSGDTIPYDGMLEALAPFDLDIAMLPINGRAPERRVDGNLWGREAAWLADQADIKMVIPCHYDMFTFNTESPAELLREAKRLGRSVEVLQNGQRYSSRK